MLHRQRQTWYSNAPTTRRAVANLNLSLKQARHFNYPLHTKGNVMNKDQVKGQAKTMAGKVQEATGKLVDSKTQQAKGVKLQVEGQVQKVYGDAKEVVADVRQTAKDAQKSHPSHSR
jgi:uncharacterized protein YjbJ (UPF0337 family)